MSTQGAYSNHYDILGAPKNVPNFDALDFAASPELYNSFHTLLVYFHDLMNKWQSGYVPNLILLKTGIL